MVFEAQVVLVFWSVKGGSGTTVVTAIAALLSANAGVETIVTGVDDDLAVMLSLQPTEGPGLRQWLQSSESVSPQALQKLLVSAGPNLDLLPAGDDWNSRAKGRDGLRHAFDEKLIVDAGIVDQNSSTTSLINEATHSLVVMKPCFLAVKRAASSKVRRDGIVLVEEPGRVIDRRDIEDVLGVPIVATLAWDSSIARSVDAGRLATKIPHAARGLRMLMNTHLTR